MPLFLVSVRLCLTDLKSRIFLKDYKEWISKCIISNCYFLLSSPCKGKHLERVYVTRSPQNVFCHRICEQARKTKITTLRQSTLDASVCVISADNVTKSPPGCRPFPTVRLLGPSPLIKCSERENAKCIQGNYGHGFE
jgi:hypothetical protein